MKLQSSLEEQPGFLHAVPVFDLLALVGMFLLLGPLLLTRSGISVELPKSEFQLERYEDPIVVTLGPGSPAARIHLGRELVTTEELEQSLIQLHEDSEIGSSIVLLQTDKGTPVGTEREVSEMILAIGFRLALVGAEEGRDFDE